MVEKTLKNNRNTECEVNVDDDGLVSIAGDNTEKCNKALEMLKAITFEPEVEWNLMQL